MIKANKVRLFSIIIIIILCFSACNTVGKQTVFEVPQLSSAPMSAATNANVIPTQVPVIKPTKTSATFFSVGDVIMHDALVQSGEDVNGTYNYNEIFARVKPYIEQSDYSVISFEGACMETDDNYTGYPLFNAPPAIISAFSYAGFDMVNNGNNHCLDRGLAGLLETRSIIKQKGMQVIGTFNNVTEPRHRIQDLNGIKVGFLSYTYGCNMNENRLTEEERNKHLCLIDKERIQNEIEALSPLVDLVVVLMHWGAEYRLEPNNEQVELADLAFQSGADIILGSHPHVIESSEIREIDGDTKYVIYSMGNFLSNQIGGNNPNARNNDYTQEGVMVSFELEKDLTSDKTRIISIKHIPTWLHRVTENNNYKYSIIPIPSLEDDIFNEADDKLEEKLIESYNRTMEKMQDYPASP
ncbi:MAG TPA: CapA family protein [Thermoclostridium sp.]|nr:CapA family protein [Thermoclostridium sp.]